MSSMTKAFYSFSHFFVGNFLSLLLGFITFPILTRILSRDEYGVLGLVTTTMMIAVAVAKAGLSEGIIRYYGEYNKSCEDKSIFSSTIFIRGVTLSILACIIYLVILKLSNNYFKLTEQDELCFIIMVGYLAARPLNILILSILRVAGKSIFLNLTEFFGKLISIILSLIFYISIFKKMYGFFIGIVAAELSISFFLYNWFFKNYKIRFKLISSYLSKKLIFFGLPLFFSEIIYLLMTYTDRYMIAALRNNNELGIYTVGYNIAKYIADLIMFPISYAIVPSYVNVYNKEGKLETEKFLSNCLYYILIGVIPVVFGYCAISDELIALVASKKYSDASQFSYIILIGNITFGLNNILNAGLYIKKKTVVIMIIMVVALIENFILNIYLIPKYSTIGASISSFATCITTSILTILISFRYISLKIDKRIGVILIGSAIMYYLVGMIKIFDGWFNIILKILTGALIVFATVLIIDKKAIKRIAELLKINEYSKIKFKKFIEKLM